MGAEGTHLHAALTPPLHVRQTLDALVRQVSVAPTRQPSASVGRWTRVRTRRQAGTPAQELNFDQLDFVPVADVHVSLASFGMVTREDKGRLAGALVEGVDVPGQVNLRIAGGCALEVPGDGRPRTRPEAMLADKAYSSRGNRTMLSSRKIKVVIPEKDDQKANRQRRGTAVGGAATAVDTITRLPIGGRRRTT